jgi:beta-glucuronidase
LIPLPVSQPRCLETNKLTMPQRPFMAGMQMWNFADFKTGQGTSRAGGMNFKGAFTRDRRPKMAAHFLRSRWAER